MKHPRPLGLGLVLGLSAITVACARWKITSVLVNPQPLGGSETVFPVMLVAPTTPGIPSQQNVIVEAVLQREAGFNDGLLFRINYRYNHPGLNNRRVVSTDSLTAVPGSNHVSRVALAATCTRVESPGVPPSVRLDVRNPVNIATGVSISLTGTEQTTIQFDIEASTNDPATGDWVTYSAAKPLQISCWRDTPPIN